MSYQESRPYVVSADSQGLLRQWAREQQLTVPNTNYFQGMLKDLEQTLSRYFDQVDVVPEEFLRRGLSELIARAPYPVVSLDRAYISPNQQNLLGYLDATRTVDQNLANTGLGGRAREITLERQIGRIGSQQSGQVILLVDDVVFEGKTMLQLIQKLRNKGVTIDAVYSGITIKDGQDLLEQNGVRVESLLVYDQVVDEICERDFVVGAPYSGRSVVTPSGQIAGAPYLKPFGKPVEWASIPPEFADEFSLFCLAQSVELWKKAEQLSQQTIATQQLAKPVFGLSANSSMSSAVGEAMAEMKGGE